MGISNPETDETNRRKLISAPVRWHDVKPAAALVRAEFGARSHRGRVHPQNDDHYLLLRLTHRLDTLLTSLSRLDLPSPFREYAYGAVVADGIGRDGAGAVAARLAISTLATPSNGRNGSTTRPTKQCFAEADPSRRWPACRPRSLASTASGATCSLRMSDTRDVTCSETAASSS